MSHLRRSVFLGIAAGWLSGSIISGAQQPTGPLVHPAPPPAFPVGPPTNGSVIVENEYRYTIRQYTPPVDVVMVSRAAAKYDNPEAAAIAGISAMVAQDVEWFRATWDAPSAALLEKRDREQGQDAGFWTKAWQRAFTGKKVQLVTRMETGQYVIVGYRVIDPKEQSGGKSPGADFELVTVLKRDGEKWFATQELTQDPVLVYRKTPDARQRRVIR
jgi:hypothetical protein